MKEIASIGRRRCASVCVLFLSLLFLAESHTKSGEGGRQRETEAVGDIEMLVPLS